MPLFFGKREFAIVSGLKCHPPSEPIPEFIVNKESRRQKKGGKEEIRQSTEEQDLVSLVGTSFKNLDLVYLLNVEDTSRKHKESLCLLWFVHNVLLAKDLNNNISLKWAWAFEAIPYLTHQVVHPWLVPTEKELQMSYLITLGLVETLFDPVVDRVKMELAGARTIKRDRVVNELVVFDGVDGRGIDVGAGVGQDQGAISCRRCFGYLYEKCKKQDEDSIMYLQTLSQEKEKIFIKAIQNLKKKIFGELPMAVGEEVLEFKHYVDEIISLMRERHVRYPEYYDSTDRILDLNFYFNFKLRYGKMSEEATTVSGRSFTQLINEFEWDEDMINYLNGMKI
ncbi:hypothetical protein KY284_001091 [Solanum tuberosum]|nr:hypothetical protein KY284_001091 [Solanum tuberosum]